MKTTPRHHRLERNVETASASRRRLFRIGPGLIIALVAAVIIGGNALKNEYAARQANQGPIIERHTVVGSDKAGLTPDAQFLLDRKGKLGLTSQQLSRLVKLQSEWKRTEAPLMREARRREQKFNAYLTKARNAPRTPLAQIQKEAAPYIAISSEIAMERKRYWRRAVEALTPKQLKIVESERKKPHPATSH